MRPYKGQPNILFVQNSIWLTNAFQKGYILKSVVPFVNSINAEITLVWTKNYMVTVHPQKPIETCLKGSVIKESHHYISISRALVGGIM